MNQEAVVLAVRVRITYLIAALGMGCIGWGIFHRSLSLVLAASCFGIGWLLLQSMLVRSARVAASALVRDAVRGRNFVLVVPGRLGGRTARISARIFLPFHRTQNTHDSQDAELSDSSTSVWVVGLVLAVAATAAVGFILFKDEPNIRDSSGSTSTDSLPASESGAMFYESRKAALP